MRRVCSFLGEMDWLGSLAPCLARVEQWETSRRVCCNGRQGTSREAGCRLWGLQCSAQGPAGNTRVPVMGSLTQICVLQGRYQACTTRAQKCVFLGLSDVQTQDFSGLERRPLPLHTGCLQQTEPFSLGLLDCPRCLLLTLNTLYLQLGRHSALWSRGKPFWEEPTDLGSQFFSSWDRQFQVHKWGLSVTNESMLLEINVIPSNDRGDVLFIWGGSHRSLPDSRLSAKTGKPAHQPLEFLERSI